MPGLAGLVAWVLCLVQAAASSAAPVEVHGATDAFAAPGVAIAWGVLRSAQGGEAAVVIRVAAAAGTYGWVAVAGVDPFTGRRESAAPVGLVDGVVDLHLPRARFADLPRSEVRFYPTQQALAADQPALVVYYLGVPDTTPEFVSEDALAAHLARRIGELRQKAGGQPK